MIFFLYNAVSFCLSSAFETVLVKENYLCFKRVFFYVCLSLPASVNTISSVEWNEFLGAPDTTTSCCCCFRGCYKKITMKQAKCTAEMLV